MNYVWSGRPLGDDQYDAIVKLLALTGQRANEIAGAAMGRNRLRPRCHLPARLAEPRTADRMRSRWRRRCAICCKSQPKAADRELIFGQGAGPFSGFSRCKETTGRRIAELNGGKS